jgi:hypothetical protein
VKEFFRQEITILVPFLTEWISFYVTWCVFWLFLTGVRSYLCKLRDKSMKEKTILTQLYLKTPLPKEIISKWMYYRQISCALQCLRPSVKNSYDIKHNSLHLSQNFYLSFYVHLACAIPEDKRPLTFASSVYNLLVCHRTSILH